MILKRSASLFLIFLLLLSFFPVPVTAAGEQDDINDLLEQGGRVELEDREYIITGPLYIYSNTTLTGGPNTVLKVECPGGRPWFTNSVGVINTKGPVNNVEIFGFEIDGNCLSFPFEWHHSRADTAHDQEHLIRIIGYSNKFGNNIQIHNMKLHDSFSDGVKVAFSNNVRVYDNFISNCQHEGVYLSCCIDSRVYGNEVAGITSDCLRLDNCIRVKVYKNVLFSYSGITNTYAHGENGIQVGDAGVSHGYDGRNKPTSTQDIEIYENTLINNGLKAILLDSVALDPSNNVYIHDNEIIGKEDLETRGSTFDINILKYINGNYTYEHQPTVTDSEDVFSNVLNILKLKFYNDGHTGQDPEDIPVTVERTERGLLSGGIAVVGFEDSVNINGVPYVENNDSYIIKSSVIYSPLFSSYGFGSTKLSKTENVEVKEGLIYATLEVKLTESKLKENNGVRYRTTRTLQRTTFKADPVPCPEVLSLPGELQVKLDIFLGAENYTTISLPEGIEGLQRIEVSYKNESVKRTFLIGERNENDNGVSYTNFSTLEMWDGSLNHTGDKIKIDGDLDKNDLTIKAYSVYGEVPVRTSEEVHRFTGEPTKRENIIVGLKILVIIYFGYKILRLVF